MGKKGDQKTDDTKARQKRMEKGDYIIQVHIIEARDLKPRYEYAFIHSCP